VAARRFFVSTADCQTAPMSQAGAAPLTCSARGCRAPAAWTLLWNNPTLHTEERRKTWLACEAHRDSLSGFLTARGFLRTVTRLPSA
jgi:hypothetical protein